MNAKCSLCQDVGQLAKWSTMGVMGAKVHRENGEGLGVDFGRAITQRMGIARPWSRLTD